eukprot:tig00000571_g2170.t1
MSPRGRPACRAADSLRQARACNAFALAAIQAAASRSRGSPVVSRGVEACAHSSFHGTRLSERAQRRVFGVSSSGHRSFAAPCRRFFIAASGSDEKRTSVAEADAVLPEKFEILVPFFDSVSLSAETIRNIVLVLSLFPLLSNYYCYEIASALQSYIKESFAIDNTGFAQLYTAYELPNIIMPLVDGAIIDRVGLRRGSIIFALVVLLGVGIVAAGPFLDAYWIMLIGRVLFGIGSEGLNVAMDVLYAKWFSGRGMAFAAGIGAFAGRLGDVLSFNLAPPLAERLGGYQYSLLTAPMIAAVASLSMFVYGYFDSLADSAIPAATPRPDAEEPPPGAAGGAEAGPKGPLDSAKEILTSVVDLPTVFWIISGVCFFYYATYYPFQAFAPEFMKQKFGYGAEQAARATSAMGAVSMFLSPVAGAGIDRVGKRAFIAAMCAAVMIPCMLTLTFTGLPPYLPMALIGCMFSLVPSAVWPSLAILVDPSLHGVAYGALTSVINIGLLGSYFALGKAADTLGVLWGVPMLVMLFICLGGTCAIAWNVVDARTGGLANASDDKINEILEERAARHRERAAESAADAAAAAAEGGRTSREGEPEPAARRPLAPRRPLASARRRTPPSARAHSPSRCIILGLSFIIRKILNPDPA